MLRLQGCNRDTKIGCWKTTSGSRWGRPGVQTRSGTDIETQVQDISGGCGSMYALDIESPKFKGLTVIKQHKLVNQVLKEEIAQWHGVQLRTKAA